MCVKSHSLNGTLKIRACNTFLRKGRGRRRERKREREREKEGAREREERVCVCGGEE